MRGLYRTLFPWLLGLTDTSERAALRHKGLTAFLLQYVDPFQFDPVMEAHVTITKTPMCRGKYVRKVCVYGRGDLAWLESQQPQYWFANKFDPEFDAVPLRCLGLTMLARTRRDHVVEAGRRNVVVGGEDVKPA